MTIKIVIVSDIFGQTKALDSLAVNLSDNISIVDPYNEVRHSFDNDRQAYEYFTQCGGMQVYIRLLASKLKQLKEPYLLIGFSAGAAAAWHYLSSPDGYCRAAALFYGGQIRHYTALEPLVETTIIHPKMEEHFDLKEVENQLISKPRVNIESTQYLHGFMNEYSKGFNREGLNNYTKWILRLKQKNLR